MKNILLEEPNPISLKVVEINEKTDSLNNALGVTEERTAELIEKMLNLFAKSDNIAQLGEILSKECKHPNELYMLGVMVGIRQFRLVSNKLTIIDNI